MKTCFAVALALLASTAAPAFAGPAPCGGDCDGDRAVSISELVRAVSIALGGAPASHCASIDADGDGRVTIAELIGAVNAALGGCDGARTTPTAVPTPTATPGVFVPGCDNNGSFTVGYSNVSGDSNAVTAPLTLRVISATQYFEPRNGLYVLQITGLECTDNTPRLGRSVQLQIIGSPSGFTVGQYPITPPLGSIIYGELQDPNVFLRAWDTAGGTLTVESIEGSRLRFRITAPMKPQPLLDFGTTTQGTFTLDVSGTVQHFVSG